MRRLKITLLLFVAVPLLLQTGCEENSAEPDNASETPGVVGNWIMANSTGNTTDYMILNDQDEYYFLSADEINFHSVSNGYYTLSDNVLDFGSFNASYELSADGNTLSLTAIGETETFTRTASVPAPEEWVKPLTVVSTTEIPYDLGYHPDIASDRTNLWVYRMNLMTDGDVMKMSTDGDSLGTAAGSFYSGLEYANNLLWTLKHPDFTYNTCTFRGINPETGEILDSLSVTYTSYSSFEDEFIARTGDAFWIVDRSGDMLLKYDATNGALLKQMPFSFIDGLTAMNGKLMACYMYSIVEIDPETGRIVETYGSPLDFTGGLESLPNYNGLAWDGTRFYTINTDLLGGNTQLIELSIGQ